MKKKKLSVIHSLFDNNARRYQSKMKLTVRSWFIFATAQLRNDLTAQFIKAKKKPKEIAAEFTDWKVIEQKGNILIKPAILEIVNVGAKQVYKSFNIVASFDVLNPRVVKLAETITAKLVREVTGETQKGIQAYIAQGIEQGKSMNTVAKELRSIVGLTENQTQSIINYRTLLEDKDKYPKLSNADIDRKVQKYADQTLRRRTDAIARTETARAQSRGYLEGLLELGIDKFEFSAFPGCCEVCEAQDGEVFDIDLKEDMIPVHPNCRCAPIAPENAVELAEEKVKEAEELVTEESEVAET